MMIAKGVAFDLADVAFIRDPNTMIEVHTE